MLDLSGVGTEKPNPRSENFSSMSIRQAIELMNSEDYKAVACVEKEFDKIEKLIEKTSRALERGGRIVYIGAGTSGRLGVLDAVECPPTFGVDQNTVVGLIAGGENAFVKAKEGAEDSKKEGAEDLKKIGFNKEDVLVGIAASGRTPYVIGAIEYAKSLGAENGAIVCSYDSAISKICDLTIEAVPGPEVLTGSTRLKAGTATKLILNMISTISMKMVGKIYKNYMVDLKLTNEKLRTRGLNIVMAVTGASRELAAEKLEEGEGQVKLAIVMILMSCSKDEAIDLLEKANGHIENLEKGEK